MTKMLMGISVGQIFTAGGVVMVPLLVCSVLAIALIVERSLFWLKLNRRQKRFSKAILSRGD